MSKNFMKIDMQVVTRLSDDKLNVLVGGQNDASGKGLKELFDLLLGGVEINYRCKINKCTNNC